MRFMTLAISKGILLEVSIAFLISAENDQQFTKCREQKRLFSGLGSLVRAVRLILKVMSFASGGKKCMTSACP